MRNENEKEEKVRTQFIPSCRFCFFTGYGIGWVSFAWPTYKLL